MPLVSIIITTYRRPELLSRSIESVLKQTYSNIEIIVVDDNDPDTTYRKDTEKIMSIYESYENITYVQQPHNMKQPAALNKGIQISKGEYIGFLDDDDEFLPKKIESQVLLLSKYKESNKVGGVYCNVYIQKKDKLERTNYTKEKCQGNLLYPMLMYKIAYFGSSVLLRRECIKSINGFNEKIKRHVDYEFFCRFFRSYELVLEEEGLLKINVEGLRNNPTPEKYLQVKNDFFKEVDSYLSILSTKEYNQVYTHNYLDVSLSFFANRKFSEGCLILKKALSYGFLNREDFVLLFKILVSNYILRR